jgi:hypothetical protein
MKFLFCALDSRSFVHPFIGIARSLHQRGHETAMVTGRAFGPLLESEGMPRFPCGERDGPSFAVPQRHSPAAIAVQVKHIEFALRWFDADVLVGHQETVGPLLVRERQGRPTAMLGTSASLWPRTAPPPAAATAVVPATPREAARRGRFGQTLDLCNRARTLTGLAPAGYADGAAALTGDLGLLRSVGALVDPDALARRVELVGDCLWEPAAIDAELDGWLDRAAASGLPIVHLHHGRQCACKSFWPALTAALAGAPCQVAAAVGETVSGTADAPANFFVRDRLPQGRLLAAARLLVTGGSATAVLGAMRAGIPSLLLPQGAEQQEVAAACAQAGAGFVLPEPARESATIRTALHLLLTEPAFGTATAALRDAFTAFDSHDRAAEHLERLAS